MFPGITVDDKRQGHPAQSIEQGKSLPPVTRLSNLAPASHPDKFENGDHSPRGPLSVDLSEEGTSRSGTVDDELARTFDLRDLESAE